MDVECDEGKRKYAYLPLLQEIKAPQLMVFGGLQEMTQAGLDELHPKLTTAFNQLSSKDDVFDVTLKRIVSGKYQVVAGSHYLLKVEAIPKTNANEVKLCEADIFEHLKSELNKVEVK